MANYIDFAAATQLTQAVAAVFDPDKSREAGNVLRYILLEQVEEDKALVTGYLTGNVWCTHYVTAHGVIGSKFLIDGEDLKNRVNGDIWNNPLRLSSTPRNVVNLECVISADSDVHANIECNAYTGSLDEFTPPAFIADKSVILTDAWQFRKAVSYLVEFSKFQGDTRDRAVWFKSQDGELFLYGPEFDGQSSISYIKASSGPFIKTGDVNFGIQARHLARVAQVFNESHSVNIDFDQQRNCVRFSSDAGSITLPLVDSSFCRHLSEGAPLLMNYPPLTQESQRVFKLKDLLGALTIQTPKKDANSQDLLLTAEDSYMLVTKQADILKREKAYVNYADITGMDIPWSTIVANHKYLKPCLTVLIKYMKQLSNQERPNDLELSTEEFWELEDEPLDTDLVTLTQSYWAEKRKWCLFIDPVPYSEDCRTFLSIKLPRDVADRLEGE